MDRQGTGNKHVNQCIVKERKYRYYNKESGIEGEIMFSQLVTVDRFTTVRYVHPKTVYQMRKFMLKQNVLHHDFQFNRSEEQFIAYYSKFI